MLIQNEWFNSLRYRGAFQFFANRVDTDQETLVKGA